MAIRLYVGNLAYNTTGDDLRMMFAQAGEVASVDVIMDRVSGRSKGFAFVTMNTQEEAEKAISMFNGFSVHERELTVSPAKPREERAVSYGQSSSRGPRGRGRRGGNRRY